MQELRRTVDHFLTALNSMTEMALQMAHASWDEPGRAGTDNTKE